MYTNNDTDMTWTKKTTEIKSTTQHQSTSKQLMYELRVSRVWLADLV